MSSNFNAALRAEIERLMGKEVRAAVDPLRKQLADQFKTIGSLTRNVEAMLRASGQPQPAARPGNGKAAKKARPERAAAKSKAKKVATKKAVAPKAKTAKKASKKVAKAETAPPSGGAKDPSARAKKVTGSEGFAAEKFRNLRERLGLSAAKMGELIGASGQSVYNWEAGKGSPRPEVIDRIAQVAQSKP
jgi:DNA-binding XRE family transcriptional regulator